MGLFSKLRAYAGGGDKMQALRDGQKAKIPKTKKKKAAPCGIDPTTGEPRGSHWC